MLHPHPVRHRVMANAEDWPDIAHMSREELEAEVAALRHALNMLRDKATPDTPPA
jgi:ribosomal protein L29